MFILNRSSRRIDEVASRIESEYPDVQIVGRLAEVDELEAVADTTGAIVLTDSTPHDSIDVVARVRRIRQFGARVIVIGDKDFPKGVVPAMAAGADAVLPRDSSTRRVVEQVRLVAARARLAGD